MKKVFAFLLSALLISEPGIPVSAAGLLAVHTEREMRNALAQLFLITAVLFLLAIITTLYKLLSRSKRIKTAVVLLIYIAAILVLATTLFCTTIYRSASGLSALCEFVNIMF